MGTLFDYVFATKKSWIVQNKALMHDKLQAKNEVKRFSICYRHVRNERDLANSKSWINWTVEYGTIYMFSSRGVLHVDNGMSGRYYRLKLGTKLV